MLLLMFHKGETDLYTFYNRGEVIPLPPPPNPRLTRAFHYACCEYLLELENEANGGSKHNEFEPPTD